MAVCHNHAHELLPMAVTKTVMRPVLHSAAIIGREVPVWDIRDQFGDTNMLVTSNEMGNSLASAVGAGKAALMRGHGSVIRKFRFLSDPLTLNSSQIFNAQ